MSATDTVSKEINIAKSFFFIQDFFSWIVTKVPFTLQHNLEKYLTIKKAFYLTALENLQGDYYEFGVFTGSSFVCAMRSHNAFKHLGNTTTDFYGFDSFKGFGNVQDGDKHWFYRDSIFEINEKKVLNFIRKKSGKNKVKIIKGFFDKTLKNKTCKELTKTKARIIFIDCDMKAPAALALDYTKPALQQGTIMILDDFFSYYGNKNKGLAGAFFDFCKKNKNIEFRELCRYGAGGIAYIVSDVK